MGHRLLPVSLLRGGMYTEEHIFSLYDSNPTGSESPADSIDDEESARLGLLKFLFNLLILLYSWHIRTWLLTQKAGLIMSRLQQNHLKKTKREQHNDVLTTV